MSRDVLVSAPPHPTNVVADTFRPSVESIDVVRTWLIEDGYLDGSRIQISQSGGWILANVTVEEAEHLLGLEYYVYEHADGGRKHIACQGAYHLPEHVSKHVDLVTPTVHFDVSVKKHTSTLHGVDFRFKPKFGGPVQKFFSDLSNCEETITLACLRALYNFDYNPIATQRNSIGVAEYSPQTNIPSDFDVYFGNYSQSQIGQRPTLISIDGGAITPPVNASDPRESVAESNLDLQTIMGLVGKEQEVLLYQVGDTIEGGSLGSLLDGLDSSYCGGDDPDVDPVYPDPSPGGYTGAQTCGGIRQAYVMSTSYGYNEADLTPAYMQRQCAEYGKLSLTGMTFVFSSGDNGVAGNDALCLDESGDQTLNGTRFNPGFPSGCPYITSVGATQIVPGNKVTDPESAVFQRYFGGGGFSNTFPRQSFQRDAVAGYLKNFSPSYASPEIYNTSGRGFPDVSANGLNYSIAVNGELSLISGTSAAAPTFAAILSQVNDARLAAGKKTVGWVNPALYSLPSFAFNDITNGSNAGCGTDGFKATPGWDPITGLGTPNFGVMVAEFLKLP